MSRIAYVNGRYLPHRHAQVHIEDRGYQFADGVYEVVYLHHGRLVDADLHLRRLARSLRELRIALPVAESALLSIMGELRARNRVHEGLIYVQVTRGAARRDHAFPRPGTRPALVATIRRTPPFPKNIDGWTGTAITVPDQRWARCDIKTVSLLPNVLAKQAAREQGATEAIMVAADGTITEGSSTTVWIVDANGILRTRALSESVLPGCTRAALAEELGAVGIAFDERPFTAEELTEATEIFLTSATSFVKPMLKLNGAPVGDGAPGPVARRLFAILARRMSGGVNSGRS